MEKVRQKTRKRTLYKVYELEFSSETKPKEGEEEETKTEDPKKKRESVPPTPFIKE